MRDTLPPSPLRGWSEPVSPEMLAQAAHLRAPEGAAKALNRLKRDFQAEYSAGLPSRLRRTRSALGGLADAHMFVSIQFWNTREYARDMDRNDALFKQLVDRAVEMRIGSGPTPRPMTGDDELNRWLSAKWRRWAENPYVCDAAKKKAFPEVVRALERATIVDGDIFVVPVDEGPGVGALQLIEGDHVDSPQMIGGDTFHGVRIDPTTDAPISYRFVKVSDRLNFAHLIYYAWASDPSRYTERMAFDEEGLPVVLHIYDPSRITQTRGITAFHAVFDYFGMVEDTMFSTLVKQQMASCVMGFLESPWDMAWGSRTTETQGDGTLQTLQELQPGVVLRGPAGTKLTPFTPNIPGSDFLNHLQFNVRLLGGALHLPLEIALMDYSLGNYSSQRMAIDQARQGVLFRRDSLGRLTLAPVYEWKARGWLLERGIDAREHPEALDHKWRWGGFPYHDKRADAEADKIRIDNLQVSPRELAIENGYDWEEQVQETVEDRGLMIESAKERAALIKPDENGERVSWRDLLNLAPPAGMTQNQTQTTQTDQDGKTQSKSRAAAEEPEMRSEEVRTLVRAETGPVVAAIQRLIEVVAMTQRTPSPAGPQIIQHIEHATMPMSESASVAMSAQVATSVEKQEVHITIAEGAVKNTFAPVNNMEQRIEVRPTPIVVEARAGELTVNSRVKADVHLPARPPRTMRVTHADGTESMITSSDEVSGPN